MPVLAPVRPDPPGSLEAAVATMGQLPDVDVAFSARLDRLRTTFVLGEVRGARATSLQGLVVPAGCGVGGKCMALGVPVAVSDYVRAPDITHQFDHAVSQEGLRAMVAVPFRVDGEVRGVVYGAARHPAGFGERFLRVAVSIVRAAERGIAQQAADDLLATGEGLAGTHRVLEMRELHAELRALAATAGERTVRERLHEICERLRPEARPGSSGDLVALAGVRLSPREVDVLAQVAVGCSNAEVASRLTLRVDTVKSYLKSAMSKLDSHNRVEAVYVARRAGLLP